jgi:hypothetical protein
MIRKKPAPDPIRGGNRFSEKIMLHQKARAQSLQSEAIALDAVAAERQPRKIT